MSSAFSDGHFDVYKYSCPAGSTAYNVRYAVRCIYETVCTIRTWRGRDPRRAVIWYTKRGLQILNTNPQTRHKTSAYGKSNLF